MAARGIVFGAIGTAGQRCTSTRRLIVHESVADDLLARLRTAYASARIGRSEEHTSELQSLMRISYAVFCLKIKKTQNHHIKHKIKIKLHKQTHKHTRHH